MYDGSFALAQKLFPSTFSMEMTIATYFCVRLDGTKE